MQVQKDKQKEIRLAIIGTAGRLDDAPKLTLEKWNSCKRFIAHFVKYYDIKHVISGGAAGMDHLAVGLYIAHLIEKLDLAFPARFDMKKVEFEDTGEDYSWNNPGATANFYHRHFSKIIGVDTLTQVKQAIEK